MSRLSRLAGAAVMATMLAACAQSGVSTTPAQPAVEAVAHQTQAVMALAKTPLHMMPVFTGQKNDVHRNLSGLLNWGGGAVQHHPIIYVAFWGYKKGGDPDNVFGTLTQFLLGVGGSNWLSTVTQYYDGSGDIDNPAGQFTLKKPKRYIYVGGKVPNSPSDQQVAAIAAKLVAKFGANANASYVVATPHLHNSPGFGSTFCAYHGAFKSGGVNIGYTNLPYMPDAGASCGAGFVNKPGTLDGVTIVEGHELAETQTDPGADYSGWGGNDGEIGDICAWDSTTSNQPFTTGNFPVQPLYSDVASECTLTGPNGP